MIMAGSCSTLAVYTRHFPEVPTEQSAATRHRWALGTVRSSVPPFRNAVTIIRNGGTDSLHFKKWNEPSNFGYIGGPFLRYNLVHSSVPLFLLNKSLSECQLSQVEPFTGQNSETHSTPTRSAGSISIPIRIFR